MPPHCHELESTRRERPSSGPLTGNGVASRYARALLGSLGWPVADPAPQRDPHPAIEWARSGAMALTGLPDGPPRLAPGAIASCARGALDAARALAPRPHALDLDGPALLGERAAFLGLTRRGTTSPGGSCRLLPAADAWIAVNLARADDLALLPAWLGEGVVEDPWRFVEERVAGHRAAEVVERGRLLGLPVAVAAEPDRDAPPWIRVEARGPARARPAADRPLVVDLSVLWAGPLCTHLLDLAGARVVKVEHTRRPDGARLGPPGFYDLLNARKQSVALDLGTEAGRGALHRLVERADIVVESARPRALAQLGFDVAALVRKQPGLTWVGITGYGRRDPGARWVAFGDDAGAAAGLAVATGSGDAPLFCGDAIADPLTGIHAAVAALASWRDGQSRLLDLSLHDVAAHVLAFARDPGRACVRRSSSGWEVATGVERAAVSAPRARTARGRARPMGADTTAVLAELGLPC